MLGHHFLTLYFENTCISFHFFIFSYSFSFLSKSQTTIRIPIEFHLRRLTTDAEGK